MSEPVVQFRHFEFFYFDNKTKYEPVMIECLNKSEKAVKHFGGVFEEIKEQHKGQPDAIANPSGTELDFKLIIAEDYMEFKRATAPIVTEVLPDVKITSLPDPQEKKVLLLFNLMRNMSFDKLEECRKSRKHEDKSVVHVFDRSLNHEKKILLFVPLLFSTIDTNLSLDEQHKVILNEISDKCRFVYEYRNKTHPKYQTYMIYGLSASKREDYRFVISQFTANGVKEIDVVKVYELETMVELYHNNFFY